MEQIKFPGWSNVFAPLFYWNISYMDFPATFFCFFALVACSFKDKEKKPRKFSVCVALGFIKDAVSTLSLFCLFAC